MMVTIRQGDHRARPLRLRFWRKPRPLTYTVRFTESCRYVLDGGDQADWNKLPGIGFFAWQWPMHHRHSARWAWRYNPDMTCIEITPYCYVARKRITDRPIYYVAIGEPIALSIHPADGFYYFGIDNRLVASERTFHRKRSSYSLGLFFGGNRTAPHDVRVDLEFAP
jgi:hypothetical protein